jgi:hypothetical protein
MKKRNLLMGGMMMALLWLDAHAHPAHAQMRPPQQANLERMFEIRRITYDLVRAPRYREAVTGASSGSSISDRWLMVEVEFSTELEWTDDLMVKFTVLMGEGREMRMFGGSLTHIDIKRGSRHFSAMFMHPNAVERYGRNKVQGVYVELWYKGQRVARAVEPTTNVQWWEGREPTTGVLLSPKESPWSLIAHERFEAIKSGK